MRFLKSTFFYLALFTSIGVSSQTVFTAGSNFKYLKGNEAQAISDTWTNASFDDSGWNSSLAPFRYGDGVGGTLLDSMQGKYSTLYLRSSFNLDDIDNIESLTLMANWDDGFILWINGTEIHSSYAPATVTYDAFASGLHESGSFESFQLDLSNLSLNEGENTIAVFACNIDKNTSSDFYFDMSISKKTKPIILPNQPTFVDTVGISFDYPSGFYTSDFNLKISTTHTDAQIVYTLDGSNPQNSNNSYIGNSPVTVSIDPASSTNRGTTPAVIVRASVIKDNYNPSRSETRTYIYTNQVKTQEYPGHTWPSGSYNRQVMDYEMDSRVVNDNDYKDLIGDALTDIPSLSLVTDNENLFSADSGIYVNATNDGIDWERECTIELINPDKSEGFNVNAGVRIRGRASRTSSNPKHSFRLFFRSEYGDSKLRFPLFEDEGVSEFDKIDLRTAQNYGWNFANGENNTMVREVFARDAQKEAGQPYTRSRYYHLYINGMYWGIYQTQERSEARFSAAYLGGDKDDYDVIKIDGDNENSLEATDGNMDKWQEVYDRTLVGFESNENYFELEGKDEEGQPVQGGEVLVDIDNLIDYMMNIFYTGNFDAPVSKWNGNEKPNNMYAITNRENKTHGFKFYIHDAEHAMMMNDSNQWVPGIGLQENRVNIGDLADESVRMTVDKFSYFHIQWLHYKLSKNEEYRFRFASRAYDQLTGDGIFTEAKNLERFNKRASTIDKAIIAESARWGDANTWNDESRTRNDDWLVECNIIRNDFFPYRTDIVINQLLDAGLFPSVDAPIIQNSSNIELDKVTDFTTSMSIKIKNPLSTGSIYYTTDGSDPRLVGGGMSSSAISVASSESISFTDSRNIKSRIFKNGEWSALSEVSLMKKQSDFSDLKVTEVHYHPADLIIGNDTTSGKSFEFIEFRNTSLTEAINLSGLVIDSAIYYEFPDNYILMPQEYFVVSSKTSKFYDRYGVASSGNYEKYLSNSGERVVISHPDAGVVIDFTYSDTRPWPESADGDGPSLTSVENNPTGDPNVNTYWGYSNIDGGTPFGKSAIDTDIEEPQNIIEQTSFTIYPNPTSDQFFVQSEKDNDATIGIYNMNGMLVYNASFSGQTSISLESIGINYGIYILRIESEGKVENKKIVFNP